MKLTFSNMVLKVYSSETKDGIEIHYCSTGRRFVVFITVRDNIPYLALPQIPCFHLAFKFP